MSARVTNICRKLGIDDARSVEIEAKRKILPDDLPAIQKFFKKDKSIHHQKTAFFFDQFLDTPSLDLLKKGASLRIRYKKNGSKVYLQYKGPGYIKDGILYRSEFSTGRIRDVLLEESHHDVVHFNELGIRQILRDHVPPDMQQALYRHLGAKTIARISQGTIISIYRKDKYWLDLGPAYLEPSLDQIFAFHIARRGLHQLSSFCEYENEIKSENSSLELKLKHLDDLFEFDEALTERFHMVPEPLDKYHRCASYFVHPRRGR